MMDLLRLSGDYLDVTPTYQRYSLWENPNKKALKQTFSPLKMDTPWKINMSTENQWLEDVFPIEKVPF